MTEIKSAAALPAEHKPKDVIGCVMRVAAILTLILLFIPALNPARMSELIKENDSFFYNGHFLRRTYGGLSESHK